MYIVLLLICIILTFFIIRVFAQKLTSSLNARRRSNNIRKNASKAVVGQRYFEHLEIICPPRRTYTTSSCLNSLVRLSV